jgi:ATP-binding cassette subfamily B protein
MTHKKEKLTMQIPIRQYWMLLKNYLQPQWKTSLFLAGLLLGTIALQLVNPQIIRSFIDDAQAGAPTSVLFQAALLFLGLAVLQQVATVLASYFSEIVAWTATNALRIDLTNHCLRLDLSFHNTHTPGEMIERVDGDINNLANFFSRFVIELFGNGLLISGVLILMWLENWLVGISLSIFVSLAMIIMLRYRNVAVPQWAAERQASADFYSFLEERLAGTEDIRANGAEAYVMRNFHNLIREMLRKSLKSAMVINIILNVNQFLFAVGTAAAFALGTYLFKGDLVTIGTVYLIFHYTSMITRPMGNIAHQVEELQRAGAGIVRVQELFRVKSKITENLQPNILKPLVLSEDNVIIKKASSDNSFVSRGSRNAISLQFDGVTFGYDDSISKNKISAHEGKKEIILQDLTFALDQGRILGLLGRTGSGKTTLTRLLFRFYDPDEGSISIKTENLPNLTDIRQLPIKDLRKQVGMVTQNIQLFNATIRENLTFFNTQECDEQIIGILSDLGLGEWLKNQPDGLGTVLESGGGGLSAGEAQLLAFTRIFLSDPGLVILDEASSRLDPFTEKLIERAVDRLVRDRTAIIIAHRLGTVQKADEIMILNQGSIDEHGDREMLIKNPNSKFNHLMRTGLEEVLV